MITPQLVEATKSIAVRAGEKIMAIYNADPGITFKDDASPLTLADLAAHAYISAALGQLTPELAVVSEEDDDQAGRLAKCAGPFWLVDPLDGTKEFIARNGEFTVNLALVCDGYPVFGVVAAPALGSLYWGGLGLGAWRKSAGEVRSLMVGRGPVRRVVASKSHLNEETSAFIARLGEVELVQAGSSLKFCRVAEDAADVYPRLAPTCEWDTAAAQAVLEGAGGWVGDTGGARLRYGKADILNPHFVAASRMLAELLERA
jgi:3'(2'), 5'-bisphosphate nucleotidase